MIRLSIAWFACVALATSVTAAAAAPTTALELTWMSGCWASVNGEPGTEEQWSKPAGGTLFGIGRTVSNGKTIAWEFMRIVEEAGTLVFIALPSGQPEARFPMSEGDTHRVVFEDPAHDFPQRVIYELEKDGSLHGRIEGTINGRQQAGDFPHRRASCD